MPRKLPLLAGHCWTDECAQAVTDVGKRAMSDGIWWRKMKRNVIRDDTMRMIAEELNDDSQRPLVLAFYVVAYMLADDDGVFDFKDGKVFKRLMYAPSVDIVVSIRDALCENGVISAVFDNAFPQLNTTYMINDWRDVNESPYKERPARSIAERRAAVASRIAEEREEQYAARNVAAAARREIITAERDRSASLDVAAPLVQPVVHVDFNAMARETFDGPPLAAQTPSMSAVAQNDKNAKNVVHAQDRTVQDRTEKTAQRLCAVAHKAQHSTTTAIAQAPSNRCEAPAAVAAPPMLETPAQ